MQHQADWSRQPAGFRPAASAAAKLFGSAAGKPAVKIVQIGDSEVGKTSLLLQYTEGQYRPSFVSTIGVDYKKKTVKVEGESVNIQIWDTAGQARMRSIVPTYMQGSQGLMLVFDVTNRETFESVTFWMDEIKRTIKHPEVPRILVGNKVDLGAGSRVVSEQEGRDLAAKFGVPYVETSAKTKTNVEKAFRILVEHIVRLQNEREAAAAAGEAGSGGGSGDGGGSGPPALPSQADARKGGGGGGGGGGLKSGPAPPKTKAAAAQQGKGGAGSGGFLCCGGAPAGN
eukprot:SAG22_NODE_191_length_15699_cov_19.660192_15_plen_285_part_00